MKKYFILILVFSSVVVFPQKKSSKKSKSKVEIPKKDKDAIKKLARSLKNQKKLKDYLICTKIP